MQQSNVRFVAIWAALVPVLTGGAVLVSPLGVAHWSEVQTGLVVATVNALSALVLAAVAYLWAHTAKEPAALAGALGAVVLATVSLGNGFAWWNLADATGQLLVVFVGSILVLLLVVFVRWQVTPTSSIDVGSAVVATNYEPTLDEPLALEDHSLPGETITEPITS